MHGFIQMSRYAGMREDLVQAGGGNSSYKIASNRMLIKASGYQLADLTEQAGYAVVDPQVIRHAFFHHEQLERMTEGESNTILQNAFIEGGRPSIETFLHSISDTYTLHTHPIVVNALTCREGGMERLQELFPDALMVPYAKPGVELAKAYFQAYRSTAVGEDHVFDCVFLQNHGLVVSGKTAKEVIEKTESVVQRIEQALNCNFSAYRNTTTLWQFFPNKIVWRVTDSNILSVYEKLGGMWDHAFCPDCVVFLGKRLLELPFALHPKKITAFRQTMGEPVLLRYHQQLYLLADSVKKALEAQSVLSFSAQVMLLNQGKACIPLTDAQQNELLNWDAEKYRQGLKT